MNLGMYTILLLLMTVVPLSRNYSYVKINSLTDQMPADRFKYYFENIVRILSITLVIFAMIIYWNIPFQDMGFKTINTIFYMNQNIIVKIMILAFISWYCLYMYYVPILGVRYDREIREKAMPVIRGMNYLAPKSPSERVAWVVYSLVATAEEIIYRAFVFYVVCHLFGYDNIWWGIAISILLESMQHTPRFKIIPYVMCTSLFFSLIYAIFDSIMIVMLIKFLHYLKVLIMPFHYMEVESSFK